MDLQRLVIVKPSGNITALVFDDIAPVRLREVGAAIQSEYPSVEQVLFVQNRNGLVHGQMAGGEFCGNAARSLGYVLAKGVDSSQTFTMSGVNEPVTIEVKPDYANLKMKTNLSHEKLSLGNAPIAVVHMEGISHAIMYPKHRLFPFLSEYAARPDRWNTIMHVLDDLGLSQKPAAGLIFAQNIENGLKITPYVFVRDIETLYAETACASGSIAAASVAGKSLSILQPSGETLDVVIKKNNGHVNAEIGGSMAVLWDGPAYDLGLPKPIGRENVGDPRKRFFEGPTARAG